MRTRSLTRRSSVERWALEAQFRALPMWRKTMDACARGENALLKYYLLHATPTFTLLAA